MYISNSNIPEDTTDSTTLPVTQPMEEEEQAVVDNDDEEEEDESKMEVIEVGNFR